MLTPLTGTLTPLAQATSRNTGPWYLAGGVSDANVLFAYQPKGAASLAASYTNLALPGTRNATPGVAPFWDAVGGWSFNGTSQYLQISPALIPAFSYSVICRFSDRLAGTALFGAVGTVGVRRFSIIPVSGASVLYGWDTNYLRSPSANGGVLAMTPERPYRDGLADGADFTTASLTPAIDLGFLIGARNNPIPTDFIQAKIQAVAVYNTTLSAAQVAAITSAMQAL